MSVSPSDLDAFIAAAEKRLADLLRASGTGSLDERAASNARRRVASLKDDLLLYRASRDAIADSRRALERDSRLGEAPLPDTGIAPAVEHAPMLERRDRIERLDHAMAESVQQITEQALRVLSMEAGGQDATEAKRTLRAFEAILMEYHRSRALLVEAAELTGRPFEDR